MKFKLPFSFIALSTRCSHSTLLVKNCFVIIISVTIFSDGQYKSHNLHGSFREIDCISYSLNLDIGNAQIIN